MLGDLPRLSWLAGGSVIMMSENADGFGDFVNFDEAVDQFAAAMKVKLAMKREHGRGGWDHPTQCSQVKLLHMLKDHLAKGDMVDIGNFAMMIWGRQQRGLD